MIPSPSNRTANGLRIALGTALACVLSAGALARAKPSANDRPLSLPAYTQELAGWVQACRSLQAHPSAADALARKLPNQWSVAEGNQRFEISTGWMKSELEKLAKNPSLPPIRLQRLIERLQAMELDAKEMERLSARDEGLAHRNLDTILARPEFRDVQAPHKPNWLDRLMNRLTHWENELLAWLSGSLSGHKRFMQVLAWAILLLGSAGLLFWMIQHLLQRPGEARKPLSAASSPPTSWQKLTHSARDAAGRGEYREAIRLAYWAGIGRLEELGLWQADRTRTHREYLRLIAPGQPQSEPLAALTRQFELIWYAARPAGAPELESAFAQLEKLGCPTASALPIENS